MALFAKKGDERCPECQHYVYSSNKSLCAKSAPANVNIRLLSEQGVLRICQPCPTEMVCGGYTARKH